MTCLVQLSITSWENCPGNQSIKMYASASDTYGDQNKIIFSSSIDISREVKDLSELTLEIHRCDFDMKKCEKPFPLRFTDLCKSFNDKGAFFYGFRSMIKPPFLCPIKANKYTAPNGSFDLSAAYFLPIRDNVWVTKTKLLDWCLSVNIEYKVISDPGPLSPLNGQVHMGELQIMPQHNFKDTPAYAGF
ncbi:CLUMA_CG003015, isoform A [Clunio marinus]|uniref:CLUMA_CG003015, isoform A n=1 Tax=Clunio marinus TaxID=568069 RepID=A0A1J1HMG1_9DIPT|nr:CLUMA_CG003015, isoform A [Clunio marinus]